MTTDVVFDAYLDLNIILIMAAVLWALTRAVLGLTRLRRAYPLQAKLLYGVLIAIAFSPVAAGLHSLSVQWGLLAINAVPSVSDYVLAQFLNGRFEMAPTTFEKLWMSRTVFVQDVTSLGSPLAIVVMTLGVFGFSCCTIRLLLNAVRVRRLIAASHLLRCLGDIEIRLTHQATVPFSTRGWRRRYIVLPSALLTEADDLRIAIAHELQHMRQGDLGWEIALEFLRPLFFWNPAFGFFKRQVEDLRELACDQQVLSRERIGVADYCGCLLRVCRNAIEKDVHRYPIAPSVTLALPLGNKRASTVLKRRVVSMIAAGRSRPGKWATGVLGVPLLALICASALLWQSSGDWSQDRLMLSTIVNLERLDQRSLASRY